MHRGQLTTSVPKVVHETIDGETIVINLGTGTYYSLDGAGAEVWALLDRGLSSDEIASHVVQRYDADPALVERTVLALVDELLGEGLVLAIAPSPEPAATGALNGQPAPDPTANVALDGRPTPAPFVAPVLHKYTDMQEFMLVDPLHAVDEEAGWPHAKAG